MLSSSMYSEAHPRRNTVFVSRIGLRDAAFASRMNLRDAAHSAPTPSRVPHPFRSAARPDCLQTSYANSANERFLSPLFSIHMPAVVPVVVPRSTIYLL